MLAEFYLLVANTKFKSTLWRKLMPILYNQLDVTYNVTMILNLLQNEWVYQSKYLYDQSRDILNRFKIEELSIDKK